MFWMLELVDCLDKVRKENYQKETEIKSFNYLGF